MADESLMLLLENISSQIAAVASSNEQLSSSVTDIQTKQAGMKEKLGIVENNSSLVQELKQQMTEAISRIDDLESTEKERTKRAEEHRQHRIAIAYKVLTGVILAAVLAWLGYKSS